MPTPPNVGDAVAAMRILRLFSPVCSSSHPLHLHGPSQYRTTHHLSLFEAFQQILQTHVRARTWFQCVYNHRQLQEAGEKFLSNLINRRWFFSLSQVTNFHQKLCEENSHRSYLLHSSSCRIHDHFDNSALSGKILCFVSIPPFWWHDAGQPPWSQLSTFSLFFNPLPASQPSKFCPNSQFVPLCNYCLYSMRSFHSTPMSTLSTWPQLPMTESHRHYPHPSPRKDTSKQLPQLLKVF